MSFDHAVSLVTAVIAFLGLVFVALQLRAATKQRASESLVKVYDINRDLLSLGFSHPELFAILNDTKHANPVWERYYLQMWLNQLSLVYSYLKQSVFDRDLRESLERDIADFMSRKNMQRHWHQHGTFYPDSFQKLVNDIIKKSEPPKAAHVKPN